MCVHKATSRRYRPLGLPVGMPPGAPPGSAASLAAAIAPRIRRLNLRPPRADRTKGETSFVGLIIPLWGPHRGPAAFFGLMLSLRGLGPDAPRGVSQSCGPPPRRRNLSARRSGRQRCAGPSFCLCDFYLRMPVAAPCIRVDQDRSAAWTGRGVRPLAKSRPWPSLLGSVRHFPGAVCRLPGALAVWAVRRMRLPTPPLVRSGRLQTALPPTPKSYPSPLRPVGLPVGMPSGAPPGGSGFCASRGRFVCRSCVAPTGLSGDCLSCPRDRPRRGPP